MEILSKKRISQSFCILLAAIIFLSATFSSTFNVLADVTVERYGRTTQPSVSYSVQTNELGVVNFQTVWGDKADNIESMESYVDEAHSKGVKLLLFPEMCVTGYCSSSDPTSAIYKWAVESAETKDGPTAQIFADLADDYNMWIVYGATEVVPEDAAIPISFNNGKDDGQSHSYNSIFACSPAGVVTTYQKITPVEGSWCLPGVDPVLLDATSAENLSLGLIGLSICYDTYACPEIGRYYAAKGANFLLNPTATSRSYSDVDGNGTRDSQGWVWYYRNRLESNADREGYKILSANLVGGDGPQKSDGSYTYNFPGGSVIVGSSATYYAGLSDASKHGTNYANLYPDTTPPISTATAGLVTNSVNFTASTGSTCRDLDFAPELYALWYKDLADRMRAGDDLKYTYSYASGTNDDSKGYENNPNVAVCNMIGTWGNAEATIKEMDGFVEEAASKNVNILVFPETVLTGYGWVDPANDPFTDSNKSMQVLTAETIPGPSTNHFKELATKYNMIIIFGMCEKTNEPIYEKVVSGTYKDQTIEKIYNSAAIVFPDKEAISYRKTQRAGASSSTGEGQWSVTGDGPVMFDTKWGKVGIDICRDGHFYPEEGRYIAAQGANIFIHITATTGGPWYRETRIGSYTDRDGMAAITANLLGLDGMIRVRDTVNSEWRFPTQAELDALDRYDITGYNSTPSAQRLVNYSYGGFNSTSLIITPYHNASGSKSFNPVSGYAISLNGTGPESEGYVTRRTSPYGLEVAAMDLSGTGFKITNFNPDLFSRMYDELAVLYREGYESIYQESDAVAATIQGLPDTVGSSSDVDKVIEASKAYDALSDNQKEEIRPQILEKLTKLQDAIAKDNQTYGDLSISGVPWNIKLEAAAISSINSVYKTFAEKHTDLKTLALLDIKLADILTGDAYQADSGNPVTIHVSGVDISGEKNVTVAYEKQDGTISYIEAEINGNTLSFKALASNLYAVAASVEQPAPTQPTDAPTTSQPTQSTTNQDSSNPETGENTTWILLPGALCLFASSLNFSSKIRKASA